MRNTVSIALSRGARSFLVLIAFLPRTIVGQQQVTVSTPYHSVGDSFFENIGIGWGFHSKGIHVQFGGPSLAAPQFGGFDPGAGANLGFGFGRGSTGRFIQANWSQGSRRSLQTLVPTVTLTDGVPGGVFVGEIKPFVVSYIPVVGIWPVIPAVFLPQAVIPTPNALSGLSADAVPEAVHRVARAPEMHEPAREANRAAMRAVAPDGPTEPAIRQAASAHVADSADPIRRLAAAQESSAGRPAVSVAEAKRLRAMEVSTQAAEAEIAYERGLAAQERGNLGAAKVYYRMAARRANDDLRRLALERLDEVERSVSDSSRR